MQLGSALEIEDLEILPFSPGSVTTIFGTGNDHRKRLRAKFDSVMCVDPALTRQMVSYQANRSVPGLRWLKYREGFSTSLLEHLYQKAGWSGSETILDPFSGIGTTALTASIYGEGVGVELMPIGIAATRAIAAATSLSAKAISDLCDLTMSCFKKKAEARFSFKHVPITKGAFSEKTERQIASLRKFADSLPSRESSLVRFIGMSVLEEVSYTRKDGQYLRWDHRSGRDNAKLDKGEIPSFDERVMARMLEFKEDIPLIRKRFRPSKIKLIQGSCLEKLLLLPQNHFDGVITSPPYANRYDYTRTYALELAYLDYSAEDFKCLRQSLLSATVENRSKKVWLRAVFDRENSLASFKHIVESVEQNAVLREVLASLKFAATRGDLPNANVIGLVENYFLEMGVVISQLSRVLKPGGTVFMVNDNVQYSGEELPVDLVLSEIAEHHGLRVERIWVLPKGKGNASQQMGRYGRREIRKCVYQWRKLP